MKQLQGLRRRPRTSVLHLLTREFARFVKREVADEDQIANVLKRRGRTQRAARQTVRGADDRQEIASALAVL